MVKPCSSTEQIVLKKTESYQQTLVGVSFIFGKILTKKNIYFQISKLSNHFWLKYSVCSNKRKD